MNMFKEMIERGYDAMGITSPMVALDYVNIYDDKVGLVIIDYEMYQMKDCDLANNIAETDTSIIMNTSNCF